MTLSPIQKEKIAQFLATTTLFLAGYGMADISVNIARIVIG